MTGQFQSLLSCVQVPAISLAEKVAVMLACAAAIESDILSPSSVTAEIGTPLSPWSGLSRKALEVAEEAEELRREGRALSGI